MHGPVLCMHGSPCPTTHPCASLQVVVATAATAWGIAPAAQLVVVAGTQAFDAGGMGGGDYPVTDLIQVRPREGVGGLVAGEEETQGRLGGELEKTGTGKGQIWVVMQRWRHGVWLGLLEGQVVGSGSAGSMGGRCELGCGRMCSAQPSFCPTNPCLCVLPADAGACGAARVR